MSRILLVEDESSIRMAIALSLTDDGFTVSEADSGRKGIEILQNDEVELAVVDLFAPDESDGLAVLRACRQAQPQVPAIVITAFGSIERAVEVVKAGAEDFLVKGFTMDELKFRLSRLLEQKRIREENRRLAGEYEKLQREVQGRHRFDRLVGSSEAFTGLLQLIGRVAEDPDTTVLLQGESGTGKELIARAIHYNGPRKSQPFVVVNCATLPEHLLESELFGYEKGAFTGANRAKPGKFETAHRGTVFIDEVAEISPKVQVELLRFTQDRTLERLGGNRPITVDVRIVAATNKHLDREVAEGRFRADLFYRLNVIPILVPPLRERKEDIPLLIDHFLEKFSREKGRNIRLSREALMKLERYRWPGNVRELENLVERLVVIVPGSAILPSDLPEQIHGGVEKETEEAAARQGSLKEACREFERLFLQRSLEKHRWNITEMARELGERRDTLSRKIKRHGLKPE